jgi:starch synthase (maltosyl-transferring)
MTSRIQPRALDLLEQALIKKQKETRLRKYRYAIPALWLSPSGRGKKKLVNPFAFYLSVVRKAKNRKPPRHGTPTGGEWTRGAVIYNMFVRTTSAFDHNGNGVLDLPVSHEGFRETGTFLKAIAMLPYIKRMGANTVHLLPITAIGQDGNKGSLGSPYAIRNPYELDDSLSEPSLGLDAKTEFKAFVEAAHGLGLRVVVEFVFRTAAKDSDWVKEHPEWMYWIKDSVQLRDPQHPDEGRYGSPIFSREELDRIHRDVHDRRFGDLLPPHPVYRDFFTQPPAGEHVQKEGGRYVGTLGDGTKVKIPGAFADWPPDDNQPPWGDVTYLRLYTHPDFNYIGYNTIRMYDTRLTQEQYVNRPLWDRIVGIIPYYQREFNIDGVMIDMGHALPMPLKQEIIAAARHGDPDFAFWDENFSIEQKSRDEGYNAVFGFLWVDEHHPDRMWNFFKRLAHNGFPIPFFGTPENHNTPRASARPGGIPYAHWALVMNAFMPTVPFIHSGFELCETYPINTGLDFTSEQISKLPSEKLPLFSDYGYNWLSKQAFDGLVKTVMDVREKHHSLVTNPAPQTFRVMETGNQVVLGYQRAPHGSGKKLAVVGNADFTKAMAATFAIETKKPALTDLLTRKRVKVKKGQVTVKLVPGQCVVWEI